MTCIRCGHEHERQWSGHEDRNPETCIANLRADLAQSRKMELDAETRACAAEDRAHKAEQMVADAALAFDKGSAFAGDAVATLQRELEAERARSWHGWMHATVWEEAHDALLRATLANI